MPCGNVFRRHKSSRKNVNAEGVTPAKKKDDKVTLPKRRNEKTSSEDLIVDEYKPTELDTPEKSPIDQKTYSVIRLHNQIEATLISDVDDEEEVEERKTSTRRSCRRSACSLTVAAGYFNDPEEFPGLAHLLEHVLTFGSDKYPEVNAFSEFMAKSGGYHGGKTKAETTTFYFECSDKYFEEATVMFSRFFIAPRMNWETIKRERQAVDAEFAESFDSDSARRIQLICGTSTSVNPAKRLACGNLQTLRTSSDEGRMMGALNLFRVTHYVGAKIKLAVQSSRSVDAIRQLVLQCFNAIPNASRRSASLSDRFPRPASTGNLFDVRGFARFYRIQSRKAIVELTVAWVLPPVVTKYKEKPLVYLFYVIGAEGKGSLIWRLRDLGFALFLTVDTEGGALTSNSLFTLFNICVRLTPLGGRRVEDVLTIIFTYLSTLRSIGPSKTIFEELTTIAKIHFTFATETKAINNVMTVSQNMVRVPPTDYLTGHVFLFEYRPATIKDYLMRMLPSKANISLQMQNHQLALDRQERWYHTKYRVDPIPEEWLQKWSTISSDPVFRLPRPNPYVPTIARPILLHAPIVPPRNLLKTELFEIWHVAASSPATSVRILVAEPSNRLTLHHAAARAMFVKTFTYGIVEDLHLAHVARIDCRISSVDRGTEISLFGFSDKIGRVLMAVARGLSNFKRNPEIKNFEVFKSIQRGNLINSMTNGERLLDDLQQNIVVNSDFTDGEKLTETESLTEDNMKQFVQNLFEGVYLKCLVVGNVGMSEATDLIKEFVEIVELKPDKFENLMFQVRAIPRGKTDISVLGFNPEDNGCYTRMLYQVDPAVSREPRKVDLIASMMQEPLYAEIRTKQQLGYTVGVKTDEINGLSSVVIYLSSQMNKFAPDFVHDRIATFVHDFVDVVNEMSDDDFAAVKNNYVDDQRGRSFRLEEPSSSDWREIRSGRYDFDQLERELRDLEGFGKKEAATLVESIFGRRSKVRRQLSMQVIGPKMYFENRGGEQLGSEVRDGGEVVYRYADGIGGVDVNVRDLFEWRNKLPFLS